MAKHESHNCDNAMEVVCNILGAALIASNPECDQEAFSLRLEDELATLMRRFHGPITGTALLKAAIRHAADIINGVRFA